MSTSRENFGRIAHAAATALFIAATALLVWRRNHIIDFGQTVPLIKPSDVLIIFSALIAIVALFFETGPAIAGRKAFLWRWAKILGVLMGVFIGGSGWFHFALRQPFSVVELGDYIRIGIGMTAFFLALYLGWRRERYMRAVAYSFLSALILTPFLFTGEAVALHSFVVVGPTAYAFFGFQTGPIILGSYLVFPIVLAFSFFLLSSSWRAYVGWGIAAILLLALMLWTGSRAGWLSVFVGMSAIGVLQGWKEGYRAAFAKGFTIPVLFIVFAFFVISPLAKNGVLVRIFPHLKANLHVAPEIVAQLPPIGKEVLALNGFSSARFFLSTYFFFDASSKEIDLQFQQSRGDIWFQHFGNIVRNPFGVGPAYASVYDAWNSAGQRVNTHSTWLEVAAVGGMLGTIAFLFLVGSAGVRLYELLRTERDVLVLCLAGAFVGILVNITFIDSLELRWFWIILGMVVVTAENRLHPVDAEKPPIP